MAIGNMNKLKEIPLLINFFSLIIVHYSYRSPLAAPDTCQKDLIELGYLEVL
jgi:hypothetical protein